MMKKSGIALAVGMAAIAVVAIKPVHSKLAEKGLIHPVNGFPIWFSDSEDVALQLCLDGDGLTGPCLFDEPIAGNAFSEATGFGPEAFWWSADATIDMPGDRGAVLVLALEAAYANEEPVDGEQFAFSRVRIRIDTPVAGTYKVWHPYLDPAKGCQPEVFNAPAGERAINVTRDIGGNTPFDTMLDGDVGPFLVWDPNVAPKAPAGYVGDPQTPHPVVGSPCGVNYFRIEGTDVAGQPVNLDGSGNNFVQTNLFSVQGKYYQADTATPAVKPVRGTYFRSTNSRGATTARVNVWVEAPSTASVQLTGLPQANQNGLMTYDADHGRFFRRGLLNATFGTQVPSSVRVTATNSAGTASAARDVPITDVVTVQSATWNASTQVLSVVALTSDRIAASSAAPTLTLRAGKKDPVQMTASSTVGRYTASLTFATPPAVVSVASSKGGTDTETVAD